MLLFSFVFMFLVFPMIKPHMCNHKAPDLNEVCYLIISTWYWWARGYPRSTVNSIRTTNSGSGSG